MSTYLIVADRMAWSLGLARKLQVLGSRDRTAEFVVVVPVDPTLHAEEAKAFMVAQEAAARARTSLQLEGFTVLEALAGPMLPRKALEQELMRGSRSYDGIIVGTTRRNPALQVQPDLVKQLERRHGIPVQVVSLDGAMSPLRHVV
jgi:hypothetical protein